MNNEPVALADGSKSLVLAVIALLVAFGVWVPTEAQTAAVLGVLAGLNVAIGALVRSRVTPTARVPLPPPVPPVN